MASTFRFMELERFGFGPNMMKKNRICLGCGHIISIDGDSCPLCGNGLSVQTLYDRYKQMHVCCPVCDTVLTEDARYCPHCGTKVIDIFQKK